MGVPRKWEFRGRAGLQAGGQGGIEEGFSPGVVFVSGDLIVPTRGEVERAAKDDHGA
jgi:hypothetical protein